ncbi:hypothetical protein [Actinokineospora sp. NBRC 105648]|uniref:hypothetical protein n=1 Tax=Actinokineospora sp. NBRC 105648 TaxID=3032206 RepID=UPI0024A3EA48|nr:hypothetical protein [Actinokineospora sp. NBRC 105648]GLZ41842.1 hypothetical protein Acsp05_54660 [Actinokineospora sp. NBRC 105648]
MHYVTRPRTLVTVLVLAVLAVLVVLVIPGGDNEKQGQASMIGLAEEIGRFVGGLRDDAQYRPPDQDERDRLTAVVDRLSRVAGAAPVADPGPSLSELGYTYRIGTDERTGRPIAVLDQQPGSDRAWGMYVVDLSTPAKLVVEVPHPVADMDTEKVGLALFQQAPGSVLAISGTHRRVADGAGDVAHRADSMFHAVVTALGATGLPQVQLHGFDNASLSGKDVVLSPGAGAAGPGFRQAAEDLADRGLRVCRAWRDQCGALEGTRNEQGVEAAAHGVPFAHVEMNRTVRSEESHWRAVVEVLAKVDFRAE